MFVDENEAPVNAAKKAKAPAAKKGGRTIEEMYQKKTQLEHILLRPDTYIGSVQKLTQPMWVFDERQEKIVYRQCTFVPGLYKIFDEIIVNAADNKQRDQNMNRMEVSIDPDENTIRVWNNGNGIPVVIHQEHGIYVPELIFGHLLTGSNFDDNEEKTTGGRNGYGAKLANIFSTEFIVETVDSSRGLKFTQRFTNNMTEKHAPQVTKCSGTDYTCITYKPDLTRFNMEFMDDDTLALLSKRVYDIAGTNLGSGSKVHIYLNNKKLAIKNFENYIQIHNGLEDPVVFARINERWEVGVSATDGAFQQVSYVNSICTTKGGQHVNYIVDQITAKLVAVIKKRIKSDAIKPHHIKNHLAVYVNCLIVNPAFDSQTKETLTTLRSQFGSTCVLSDQFLKKIENSDVVENVLRFAKYKQNAELAKKGGSKKSKLLGITKLDDANNAGTAKSKDCTLILTEGDSAKALAISGLGVVGRDYYGVFPLKGKLLNVREAAHAQIIKNEEIQNIAKILGLQFGKNYTDTSTLRYGHLMIMTDQDHDGSHIKGLLINFLHHFWPSLLQIDGFLQQFITPIVKCFRGNKEEIFFTIPEYLNWKEEHNDGAGWKTKYYKGLGTSTAAEAKDYFSNLSKHQIDFAWSDSSDDNINMAFAKKRVDDRKQWLLAMQPDVFMNYDVEAITYDEFINNELILFSHADNQRSIPHFADGFKPSQRKVLYSCFKRNLNQEIKVAQLAGYVSEHSAYHHGEASLTQTIIGMAQDFVGSNNINLLSPCGQFGTRLMSGKDAASPRYVFTKLEAITRTIFHPDDDALLEYLDDDGQSIEPVHYVPIIPMVLVNGSEGIGTGWSTSIPTYNPRDIIAYLRSVLRGDEAPELHPWYRGFTGEIRAKTGKDSGNYVVSGIIEQRDESTLVISELPVGKSTTDYKQFLESLVIGSPNAAPDAFIKDFKENHTDTTVLFTITMAPETLQTIAAEKGGLIKKFKLEGSIATSNMNCFDLQHHIHKFDRVEDIMTYFYQLRLEYYDKRKLHLTQKLTEEWEKLDNKVRFILAVIRGELVVSNRKKKDILADLAAQKYQMFLAKKIEEDDDPSATDMERGYDYLLSMKLWSLTLERVESLRTERDKKRDLLDELLGKAPSDLWLEDLDALENALDAFENVIDEKKAAEGRAQRKAAKHAGKKGKKGKKYDSDDESDFDEKPKKKGPAVKKAAPAPPAKSAVTIPSMFAKAASQSANPVAKSAPAKEQISENLTLAQRLMSRMNISPPVIDMTGDDETPVVEILSTKATNKIKRVVKQKAYGARDESDVSDDEWNADAMSEDEAPVKTSKPARQRAPKKTYVQSEESDVNDESDFIASEDDFDSPKKVKKAPAAKAPKVKPVKATKETKVPKAKAAVPKHTAKKAIAADASDGEWNADAMSEDEAPVKTSKPARQRAPKKTYVESEESDVNDESDFIASDDDFDSPKKAKKAPAAKAPKVKPAKAVKETKAPKEKTTGAKRGVKGTIKTAIDYSPGAATPKETKKARRKPEEVPVMASLLPVEKTNMSKKVAEKKPAEKKVPKKAMKAAESDEEDDAPIVKTPKPARKRNIITYVESGSEAEESEAEVSFESESDFEEDY